MAESERGQVCGVKCTVQAGCKSQGRRREGTLSSQTGRRPRVGASIIQLCMVALAGGDNQAPSLQMNLPAQTFLFSGEGSNPVLNGRYSENNWGAPVAQ